MKAKNLIPYNKLNLGFADAENYKKKENKKLLDKFFIKTGEIDNIINHNTYFLIGDKGTGKTAYSVYLSNNDYRGTSSYINYIRETEYTKFIQLKKTKNLTLTEYTSIWKVLIYVLISQKIMHREKDSFFSIYSKYAPLKEAIDAFYSNAFSPEIINAISFVEESKLAAELIYKAFKIKDEDKITKTFSNERFQTNLLYIQQKFELALASIKLQFNHILFIDGIDIRPRNIEYEDYLECIKGLANAAWTVNTDFFSNIKDSRGRMKVMLLVRPDIFSHLGLQNLNTKIRDNSVLLDWKTTYPVFLSSSIFRMSDNLLSSQQIFNYDECECWNFYFPFEAIVNGSYEHSFVSFLRFSMFRPRDIVTMMKMIQEKFGDKDIYEIKLEDFDDLEFRKRYSDYLLGEIKDYLAFYHSDKDYELFLKFFEYLNGKASFSYDEFYASYDDFATYIEKNEIDTPKFFDSSDSFLQFLYDLNILCYIEDTEEFGTHIHWSFRERTYSNINPKVKEGVRYSIHYGLQKALNTGRPLKRRLIKKNKRKM